MARRGRKPAPKPLRIAKLDGADPGFAEPPEPVAKSPLALAEWHRMIATLPAGLLSAADSAALGAYCSAFATWVLSERDVQANGLLGETGYGTAKANPCVQIAKDSRKEMLAFLAEFGATPSSRQRLKLEELRADPLEEFLAG